MDDGFYKGQWNRDEEREGYGVHVFEDGSVYEGFWWRDKYEVRGRLTSADGSMYRGEFLKGHKSGQGEEVRADGTSYSGSWK